MKHKVSITLTEKDGTKEDVLKGGIKKIPKRLIRLLFGEPVDVLFLSAGRTIESVEIRER